MADTVTSQVLENGRSRLVYKLTSVSDGTGESDVVKIDATSNTNGVFISGQNYLPGVHLVVTGLIYDVASMKVRLRWVASSNVDMIVLGGFGTMRFLDTRGGFQGLVNPLTAGATGSIALSTVGANLNSTYSIIIECKKGVPQS